MNFLIMELKKQTTNYSLRIVQICDNKDQTALYLTNSLPSASKIIRAALKIHREGSKIKQINLITKLGQS